MRITRATLLKLAQDTVLQRTRRERGILAIYLCGTLQGEDFMLGGAADIDLVFVHDDTPPAAREIVRLNDELHIDIAHHARRDYREVRSLRLHPWMGPTLAACQPLYDPTHFLDFVQASVRGQFDRPDHVLSRVRSQAEHARQMWSGFALGPPEPGAESVLTFLRALDHAANAIALLSGPPLTERRLLLGFHARAEAVRQPGLHAGLLGLLGAPLVDVDTLRGWLPAWGAALEALPADAPERLHPARRPYYTLAVEAMLGGEQPKAALWPLLRTWSLAARHLPPASPERLAWQEACQRLELSGPAFTARLEALDTYLDLVEETVEEWGRKNGA